MSLTHFRFLHAGGFALDQPLFGFAEPIEPLGELLLEAPYLAAQKVFDTALEERVDFLVLTGDLVDLAAPSPRAIAFLLENFERIEAHGIATYWASGQLDPPQDWPAAAKLPSGVQVFPSVESEELSHFRGDRPIANLVGRSWHGTTFPSVGEFKSDTDGLPTIVVTYGQADKDRLVEQAVDYWALGGQPQRQSLGTAQRVIHYPGSPQGRSPREPGPHGCTLAHIAADRAIRTQFRPTDAVRWLTERLKLEDDATLEGVRKTLAERVKQLKAEAETRPLIVSWKLRGGQHLAGPAARRDLAAELEAWLRKEFSTGTPVVWTHKVQLDQPELPDAWFDEESMLGDFLRNLKDLAALPPADVDIAQHIPEQHRTSALSALAEWGEEEHRAVLYEAALHGAGLLGAAERES